MPAIVHPHAQPEHHDTGEQRRAAFQQFTLSATDIDDIGCQCPGAETGQQRQEPTDVDATYRRLLAGVAQEGENCRQHQNGFQAFAQQDQQAGNVAQRPAQAITAEQVGGFLEFRLGSLQTLADLLKRQAVLERLAVGHERLFSVLAHIGIDVVEGAFDQLEAFQVGRYRQVVGLFMVSVLVGRQTLVQGAGGVVQQLRRATLHLRWLGALGAEHCRRFQPLRCFNFQRRLTRQISEVVARCALGLGRIRGEAGDVGSQVPALTLVELIGKGRHVGAFDALPQGVVEVIQAQPGQALAAAQVGRRWFQTDPRRAVTGTAVAMADRAVLGIQRRPARGVRGDDRGLADFIGNRQLRAELTGLTRDTGAVLALIDRLAQADHALLQRLPFGTGRQATDQALQHVSEFQLLAVFAVVHHLARLDRRRVVGTDVVEQVQGLGGVFDRVGQQRGTAQCQQRPKQPGKQAGTGNHEPISNNNARYCIVHFQWPSLKV
ncbi:hypothetical protein D3C81_1120660 [compost metagenome]